MARMQFIKRGLRPEHGRYLSLFCAGVLAGFLAMNLGRRILLEETGLFDEYTLYGMKYMTVDSSALFCYLFRKRIGGVLLLALVSTTYLGLVACMGAAFWYGMSTGAFLTALAMRYGIKGILLAVVCLFPQYLLYIPMALALCAWCEEVFRGIYYMAGGSFRDGDRGLLLKKLAQLGLICLVALLGCLLEGYVNPSLLLGFLKIF